MAAQAPEVTVHRPRICFVGPMMGSHHGWVVSPAETLAELFSRDGYQVRLTSARAHPVLRAVDAALSLIAWRREVDVVVLLVFSGRGFALADVASRIACWLGKPVVFRLSGGSLPDFFRRRPRWVRRVLDRGSACVAPSSFLAEFFRGWGYDVTVVPNALPLERYPFRHRENLAPRLLWMRTFHEIYNPMMAIEVLADLRRDYPGATLTMAGQEKGLLEETRRLAMRLGVAEAVRFAGFLDTEGKQREFPNHDLFLNTNRVDNMPVSVMEAAAFGLPIVATRVGGISHLLCDGQTALLVPDGDAVAMAAAVRRLLAEPALAAHLSEGGRRLAESCAWEAVRQSWQAVFDRVVV
jgi:L-malate glycosyltransferase